MDFILSQDVYCQRIADDHIHLALDGVRGRVIGYILVTKVGGSPNFTQIALFKLNIYKVWHTFFSEKVCRGKRAIDKSSEHRCRTNEARLAP